MHYGNLVIVKVEEPFDLDAVVEAVMGPNEEQGGFWDWYQIGGRWTGSFDGYEPEKDPANIKLCDLCGGTGKRTDMEVADGCNGCGGEGKRAEWPTQWKRYEGDVMTVENLTEDHLKKFYRIVLPDGYGTFAKERYLPWREENAFIEQELPTLAWIKETFGAKPKYGEDGDKYLAVVVDNHC